MLEGGNPIARHHGKGLERATFCHGVELSYCLVTVRALTETLIKIMSKRNRKFVLSRILFQTMYGITLSFKISV